MLPFTLRQLEIFGAVARAGSTVAAGREVGLSQSATSAALQQLERALGAPLFERVGRALVLNAAGRALRAQADALLAQAHDVAQGFGVRGALLPQRLVLGASTTVGNYVLAPLLAQFARSHPQVSVDVQIGNTREIAQAVQSLAVDLGMIEGASHWPGLVVHPWLRDELVLVAAPGDALAQAAAQRPLGLAQLRRARWLLREPGSGTRERVEQALLPRLHQLPAAATLGSSEAIARCAAQGLGISYLPRVLVQPLLAAGTLVELASVLPRIGRDFSLLARTGHTPAPALAAWVQTCLAVQDAD